jgi:hypothetical protein
MNDTNTLQSQPLDNPIIAEALAEKIKNAGSTVSIKDGKLTVSTFESIEKMSSIIDKIDNFSDKMKGLKEGMNFANFESANDNPVVPVASYSQDANPEKIKQQLAALSEVNNMKLEPEQKAQLSEAVDAQQLSGEQVQDKQPMGNFSQRIAEELAKQSAEQDVGVQR